MFAAERIKKIREILVEYKHVDVNTLCSLLSVSIATVRRDLAKLEEEGFLKKTYGGAIINETNDYELQLINNEDPFQDEKMQIAIIASKMVSDNDVIFLGSGNICLQIAKQVKEKENLKIITNNVNIVWEMLLYKNVSVILAGGDLEIINNDVSTVGQFAINNLKQMYINKSFITVDGITVEAGYTIRSSEQANLYKTLIENSEEMILVAEYIKFGKRAFTEVAPISSIKKIISNMQLPEGFKKYFFENGFEIFTTYEDVKN